MNRRVQIGGYRLLARMWIEEGVPWLPGLIVFALICAVGIWLAP